MVLDPYCCLKKCQIYGCPTIHYLLFILIIKRLRYFIFWDSWFSISILEVYFLVFVWSINEAFV